MFIQNTRSVKNETGAWTGTGIQWDGHVLEFCFDGMSKPNRSVPNSPAITACALARIRFKSVLRT